MVDNILMILIIWVTGPMSYHRLKDLRQHPEKYLEGKPLSYYKERYPSPWHNHVWFRYQTAKETFIGWLVIDVAFIGYLIYSFISYILGFF